MLRGIRDSLLSVVYPQQCHVCSGVVDSLDHGVACRDCWSATTIFTGSEMLCEKCGAFFSVKAAPVPVRCHRCDDQFYDRALAIGIYEKALSASVIALKSEPHIPRSLRQHLAAAAKRFDPALDVIVPVPLSKLRRLERGFNQAEVIATELSRSTGLPVDAFGLQRKIHTPIHRVGMDDRARELTVTNAFNVARPKLIADKRILLVDDVFTSGATASACAKVLLKNGAERVDVFTLARAVMT